MSPAGASAPAGPSLDDGAAASSSSASPPRRLVQRVARWYSGRPLRARLVGIVAVLLSVGVLATGLVTQAVVSHYLVRQVDDQLQRTASDDQALAQTVGGGAGPSDYYVLWRTPILSNALAWPQSLRLHGTPAIPVLSDAQIEDRGGRPFTVPADGGARATQWRVIALNPQVRGGVPQNSQVFVALPLSGVHEAARILGWTLWMAGAAIVLLGAGAAAALIRRSLRPLQEMETTAAAIATGDLTRRVPEEPPTTEVGSLGGSLNAMLAQIEHAFAAREESERRMRRFVSDASHELRTPLATIRGYGELYRMGALDSGAKVDDTMGRIEDAARRMGRLVNDLLELARLDEGRPLRREPVQLLPLLDDAAQDLRALDPTRTVSVVPITGTALPATLTVVGDGDRLRQVLTNLVGNVARHTPAGTPVELAAGITSDDPDAPCAVVEVRDHGPGVTPDQAARMFERFYRVDSSRNRESGGSGLGLAIVAAIVGAHGGHVELATPSDDGLTVRLELPLAAQDEQDGAKPATTDGDRLAGGSPDVEAPLR